MRAGRCIEPLFTSTEPNETFLTHLTEFRLFAELANMKSITFALLHFVWQMIFRLTAKRVTCDALASCEALRKVANDSRSCYAIGDGHHLNEFLERHQFEDFNTSRWWSYKPAIRPSTSGTSRILMETGNLKQTAEQTTLQIFKVLRRKEYLSNIPFST